MADWGLLKVMHIFRESPFLSFLMEALKSPITHSTDFDSLTLLICLSIPKTNLRRAYPQADAVIDAIHNTYIILKFTIDSLPENVKADIK